MATRTQLPPDAQALAQAHRQRQQQLALLATQQTARLWGFLEAANLAGSWTAVAPRMLQLVTAALLEASRGAQDYVSAVVRAWGAEPDPAARVAEWTFASTASDGRPLDTLLAQPALEAAAFVDQGMPADQAKMLGQRHLGRIVGTQIADAARAPTGVAQVADRKVRGYVRMVTAGACSRCVVLAGRIYHTNAGFERHPGCHCVHVPLAEDVPGDPATDPKLYFDSLSPEEQDRAFTKAGAQAVRDGADISQVVNARRGMETAGESRTRVNDQGRVVNERHRTITTRQVFGRDAFTTTEGITKRGVAGQSLGKRNKGVRLMPEQLYLEAAGSRDEALRLLRLHGYIL